jgi:hypothetical protein
MILATILASLPLGIILVVVARDLRPWWRQLRHIRALPETRSREVRDDCPT